MKDRKVVLTGVGIGVGIAIVLLLVFMAGVFWGAHGLRYSPFGRRQMMSRGFVANRLGHGVVGTIDSLGNNTLVVKDRNGQLDTVTVNNDTVIRQGTAPIKFPDLKKDENVIVIGEPQNQEGATLARVIRVIEPAAQNATGSGIFIRRMEGI